MKRARLAAITLLLSLGTSLVPPLAFGQDQSQHDELSTASLEQLTQMQIKVSSFARKDEELWKTPAAVFVISKEDIARSAVSSIPELLRMVPGIQVAQIDASTWAVSARGFNSTYADKLLVLIDGRTVYSEMYAGSHWDEIDLPFDEIERIEVIRGPGAAVWGTNAVNGVVNIITKKARSNTGLHTSDNFSRIGETADLQYGGVMGDRMQYRAIASYINRQPFEDAKGKHVFDGGNTIRGGGRLDWQRRASDLMIASGDLYGGHLKRQIAGNIALSVGPDNQESESIAGGHVLSRWEHKSDHSDTALQVYYNDQSRHELASYMRSRTIDLDFQDHLIVGSHHDLVWGAEFRFTANHLKAAVLPTTRPDYRNYLVDGFLQDQIALRPESLILTLGSKIESGTLAGFQVQPSVRILWAPNRTQSFWAGVSRAASAPSVQDKYLVMPLTLGLQGPYLVTGVLRGSSAFKPETVIAYELGYRKRITKTLSLDLASFFNDNRHLSSVYVASSLIVLTPSPHIFTELLYTNGFRSRTAGVEASAAWKPVASLSLQGSYTWMEAHTLQVGPGLLFSASSWNSPRNSFASSLSWSFAPQWSANSFLSRVDFLPVAPSLDSSTPVPSYTRLDLHITRKVGRSIEFDAGATNLLTARHIEFTSGTGFIVPLRVPRSAFVKATWSF